MTSAWAEIAQDCGHVKDVQAFGKPARATEPGPALLASAAPCRAPDASLQPYVRLKGLAIEENLTTYMTGAGPVTVE